MKKFYLGVHMPNWLGQTDVPLFLSRRRLATRQYRRCSGSWALDSGGFSELSLFGRWTVTARQYVGEVVRWSEEVGVPDFCAIMDWMCEDFILAKTGLSVREHQKRTVESYLELRGMAPWVNWLPVLQGFRLGEYMECVGMYRDAGVELSGLPLVGLGSICRRQGTAEAGRIAKTLFSCGIRLHGFGFKKDGLVRSHQYLHSADSMAWSDVARKKKIRLSGCKHLTCANCLRYAMLWRNQLLEGIHR